MIDFFYRKGTLFRPKWPGASAHVARRATERTEMARAQRRNTSWELADADFTTAAVNTIVGAEIINAGQVAAWGPGTMVRLRGYIAGVLNTSFVGTNEPGIIEL